MQEPNSNTRSRGSLLLGMFICFELLYLPASNFIKLIALRLPESKGELDDDIQLRGQQFPEPLQVVADATGTAFVRWGELTGQAQGWSLFAPIFGHQASLPAVGFGDGTIQSSFAPSDPNVYFRLPWPSCRLFNYEYRLTLLYWTWTEERYYSEDHEAVWRGAVNKRVRRQNRSLLCYLTWRMNDHLRKNTRSIKPTIVEIYAELFPAPPLDSPDSMRRANLLFPLARWSPAMTVPADCLPLQAMPWWRTPTWLPREE
jgi:hypothetical protein